MIELLGRAYETCIQRHSAGRILRVQECCVARCQGGSGVMMMSPMQAGPWQPSAAAAASPQMMMRPPGVMMQPTSNYQSGAI